MPTGPKPFQGYEEQADLLESRGMDMGDRADAVARLRQVNYYRLSGYWYPFRRLSNGVREDRFYDGTCFSDIIKLYEFDANLRAMTFACLAPIELTIRALLGHELGRVHACAHLEPISVLGPRAKGPEYARWLATYTAELNDSREDFVAHHHAKYGGVLPVWAAVEILDWGGLTRLFGFAERPTQNAVAGAFGLRAPQLESWLKSLNIVRNVCAHHGRLFNRSFALTPKLPAVGVYPGLDAAAPFNRTFGQLTLIQHLLRHHGIGRPTVLPKLMQAFPNVAGVPISHTGAPTEWTANPLWSTTS